MQMLLFYHKVCSTVCRNMQELHSSVYIATRRYSVGCVIIHIVMHLSSLNCRGSNFSQKRSQAGFGLQSKRHVQPVTVKKVRGCTTSQMQHPSATRHIASCALIQHPTPPPQPLPHPNIRPALEMIYSRDAVTDPIETAITVPANQYCIQESSTLASVQSDTTVTFIDLHYWGK